MIRKVEICGVNTSALPNLNNKEIEKMLIRIKNGEEDLKNEFIRCNLRLVLSVVQRFSNRNENMDDLFQVGCIGLIKAIDNFDTKFNVKFSTYAVPMIIGEVRRYLRDNGTIRVSRSLKDTAYKALKYKEENKDKNLSNKEIAANLGIKEKDLNFALDSIVEPCSLYDRMYNDNGDSIYLMDQVGDEKNVEENWTEKFSLKEAVDKLRGREKEIIIKRYYMGKTQIEVAKEIGISQAQVSRLEKSGLKKIKKEI
ncbi:RNA polymerase sporulation sigma factor SigG [Anaerofustis sp.]|uniref:RNA polymerase sporulation sigma factor SigG n=1 Tax=Anaerofustis sp. TaxID=1872517 RepID=UPI0025B83EE5|nr:RNA polymerase sporulation sigma factor SigG [Anaerofustis sp.]